MGSNPTHPFLHKKILKVTQRKGKISYKYKFYPSLLLLEMVKDGLFILMDESQEFKNKVSNRSEAVSAIFLSVTTTKNERYLPALKNFHKYNTSFILTMSATPFCKELHAFTYLIMFGIMSNGKKWNTVRGVVKFLSLQGLVNYCNYLDKPTTDKIYHKFFGKENLKITSEVCSSFIFDLYVNIIVKFYSRTMKIPDEEILKHKHLISRLFVNIENFDEDNPEENSYLDYILAIDRLSGAYDEFVQSSNGAKSSVELQKEINCTIHILERTKLGAMTKAAVSILETYKKDKVIFYLESLNNVRLVAEKMKSYQPIVITGEVPLFERIKRIKKFQEDDNFRFMVLISKTGKASLSFQDTKGGRRRHSFATATNYYIDSAQLAKRTNRLGVKSDTFVYFVFGKFYNIDENTKQIFRPTQERIVESTRMDTETQSMSKTYGMESYILENIGKKESVVLKQMNYDEVDQAHNAITKNTIVQGDPDIFPPMIDFMIKNQGYVLV